MAIEIKTKADIEKMRKAGQIVFQVLSELREMVKPGVTTADLNQRALELTEKSGAKPAFLNYPSRAREVPPFSGVICSSVNEEIVHGIPGPRKLVEGDIISIDYGCQIDGFFGDSAVTVPVGTVGETAAKLLKLTEESLYLALKQCVVGNRIGDISHAVQSHVEPHGLGVVREFVGHGIGRAMHEEPHIPNFGRPGQGRPLKPGMVFAIEPMITTGSYEVQLLADGWTAVTADRSLAAHFEHTVAITENGPLILTRP
jgi:methionyl aminopeptidase